MLTWRHEISTPTILQKENSQRVVSFKTNFVRIISAEIIQYYRSAIFFLQVERYKKDRYKTKEKKRKQFSFFIFDLCSFDQNFYRKKKVYTEICFWGKSRKSLFCYNFYFEPLMNFFFNLAGKISQNNSHCIHVFM